MLDVNQEVMKTASQLPTMTVANLAFKYLILEREYKLVANEWLQKSVKFQLIEGLYHLAYLARKERVNPDFANMLIIDWITSPCHTQTLCWFNQIRTCIKNNGAY